MIYFIILSLLFICLNFLDWYLTKRILAKGGQELNPVIRAIGIIPAKISVSVLLILAGYFIHWAVLVAPNVVMVGVCIWNFVQLKRK